MENLEEVLQALDEFQKMRPTVIPQELEDYLCWVAKTGDPVYQWPLIKTLFREKLTRVMTDFYESCPSLELATCPNVEHFNYDTMKSSLLERLESFANAPFTVQRICELLTSPRKEYNRVDKFMRAIEKNILVVSTREPGPIARRGETGDGMVNGSVEEDTALVIQQQPPAPPLSLSPSSSPSPSPSSSPSQSSSSSPSPSPSPTPSSSPSSSPSLSQPPLQSPPHSPSQLPQTTQLAQTGQPNSQDVEMDWENDCTSSVTISVHTVAENETPLLHSGVIPTVGSQLAKSIFTVSETTREKLEQASSRTEIATSNYVPATSDFSTISNLTSQAQLQEPVSTISAVPVVQNLPATETVSDDSLVGSNDVTEAIISEDTTSQSNLDLENEEIELTATAATTTTTMTTTATTTATSTTSAATTTVTVVATVIPLTTDTTQKLQAAFQAKHFESDDNKCLKKVNEETPVSSTIEEGIEHSMKNEETTLTKSSPECMDSNEMSHDESRLAENLLKIDTEMRSDALANDAESINEERISNKPEEEETSILEDDMDEEHLHSRIEENTKTAVFIESQSTEKESAVPSDECMSAVIVSSGEALYKTEKTETHSTETSTTISLQENFTHDQPISQKAEIIEVTDKVLEAVPDIASSNGNDDGEEAHDTGLNEDNMKLMDIINEKASLAESAVSDSISVIEKPKDVITVNEKFDLVKPTVETTEGSDISHESPKDDNLTDTEDDSLVNAQDNKTACVIKENQSSVIESVARRREHESMELMEVDDEESLSTFQQGEPMEQETMDDMSKS